MDRGRLNKEDADVDQGWVSVRRIDAPNRPGAAEIVRDLSIVGLHSRFSVATRNGLAIIHLESRGGRDPGAPRGRDRNPDYLPTLDRILYALSALGGRILDIAVDSQNVANVPLSERRVRIEEGYPVDLAGIESLDAFRKQVTRLVARTPASKAKGGNPTKRLRIDAMVPGLPRAAELAGALGARRPAMHQFEFCPSAPTATSSPSERKPLPATAISREHVKLQRALYDRLVETHGPNSVAVEMMVPCGRPADIVVSVGDRFEVYEIKVAACAKDCIRQALGQLIEYAYWPGSPGVACIVVAGPAPLDPETDEYLNLLRLDFAIPIRYERIVT